MIVDAFRWLHAIPPMQEPRGQWRYDPTCEDLAEHFLQDEFTGGETSEEFETLIRSLSQAIQDAVEGWFAARGNQVRMHVAQK
ncbi:MAG TPA: hypothetical protein VKD25_10840 [Burkholderiales bacterium]|nr:hypothetical protein [Burkholderiales bacterium]